MEKNAEIDTSPQHIVDLIHNARNRISSHLTTTPLLHEQPSNLWLKCENLQKTGSFKVRGALAKLSRIPGGSSIVTASTGNHGLGVANAAALYSLNARIYIPKTTSDKKIDMLKALGVDLQLVEGDSLSAELAGKQYASEQSLPWVSPYNDIDVISGQGTIGAEITEELKSIDKVYITVGGGGLMSGVASWLRIHSPDTEIIGCQPANSPEMTLSVAAGHVVTAPDASETLSDGSAGPLEEDSITFGICQDLINRFILIDEPDIEEGIRAIWKNHEMVVEGSAAVAYAAAIKDDKRRPEDASVVVLCGGNINPDTHRKICHV